MALPHISLSTRKLWRYVYGSAPDSECHAVQIEMPTLVYTACRKHVGTKIGDGATVTFYAQASPAGRKVCDKCQLVLLDEDQAAAAFRNRSCT